MSIAGRLHEKLVYGRRINILASRVSVLLPQDAKVLDVGCGDGAIDQLIMQLRPDITIQGIDVFIRDHTIIPVRSFDGIHIPYTSNYFDVVMFIDVLHHTENLDILLKEAKRVSRNTIILKDHVRKGLLADSTLRFMDWIGNVRYGVALPYNYWTEEQWHKAFKNLNLLIQYWDADICLYTWPATLLFDRSLHFIAELKIDSIDSNVQCK